MEVDLKQIRELMRALRQHDFVEIELEKNGERIRLRRAEKPSSATASPDSLAPAANGTSAPHSADFEPAVTAEDPSVAYISSPFVGTFYRSPSPEAPPFIDVGDAFHPKQPLCIVEAMKLMNEIEAEFAGTLLEVLVQNGLPVEYGDRLFKVRKA